MKHNLTSKEIRRKFLEFFQERGHKILPGDSLVTKDPSVLFTIAGMLPFKPIFLGEGKPIYSRVTTCQKCIRTNDIENVGHTTRHHTFFEMLGNFSFGDYSKEQTIFWGWQLSTEVFGLSPENIVVTVLEDDQETFSIWHNKIGVSKNRIKPMGKDDNFWVSGSTGPCGPCSELYYDFHPELGYQDIDLSDESRFLEFYNLVFIEYNKTQSGELIPLRSTSIDTGMGLERMTRILQEKPSNYETDLFLPIIETLTKLMGVDYDLCDKETKTSLKIISDHMRSVVYLLNEGVTFSNVRHGYVMRRLFRRVIRQCQLLKLEDNSVDELVSTIISLLSDFYPVTRSQKKNIKSSLHKEQEQFFKTLEKGEKTVEKFINRLRKQGIFTVTKEHFYYLYNTYGIPFDVIEKVLKIHNMVYQK